MLGVHLGTLRGDRWGPPPGMRTRSEDYRFILRTSEVNALLVVSGEQASLYKHVRPGQGYGNYDDSLITIREY